jgi:hypothetical protein
MTKKTKKKTAVEQTAERLGEIFGREIEGLKVGLSKAEKVREHIFSHDWQALSKGLQEMDDASHRVTEIEAERNEIFGELRYLVGAKEGSGFYSVVVRLEPELRDSLSALFRNLKVEVLQLQGITWSIDAYVKSMCETIQEILRTAFPHRRGTMYEKSGKKRDLGSDPLVLNRRL